MSEPITTKELLNFLIKAGKVSSYVTFKKINGFYEIGIRCDWNDENIFYTQTTCLTEGGSSNSMAGDYEFYTMNSMLDYLVEKKEEKETKRQKRQELLSRLTDEEKELLYFES